MITITSIGDAINFTDANGKDISVITSNIDRIDVKDDLVYLYQTIGGDANLANSPVPNTLVLDYTNVTPSYASAAALKNAILNLIQDIPFEEKIALGQVDGHFPLRIIGNNLSVGTSEESIWVPSILYPWAGVDAAAGKVKLSSSSDEDKLVYQVETATVVGAITTSGNAEVVVTSAGMTGSPKTVNVPVLGQAQVETQTIVGTVDSDGDIDVIITGALVTSTPLTVPVTVVGGVLQVETATIVGTVTGSGNLDVTVTGGLVAGSPLSVPVAVVAGTAQVETQTVVGTVTSDGDIDVVVTGALVAGSPLTVPVAVVNGTAQVETATIVGNVNTAGNIDVIVTGALVAGTPLTVPVAVDAGINQVETATIVGTIGAAGAGNINVTITGDLIIGTPLTIQVAVANDDTADQVATKVRSAFNIASITNSYAVSGATSDIILTTDSAAANDATLNIAYDNGTATGLTPDPTSVDTTAGNAVDTASDVAAKVRTALDIAAITDNYAVSGADADIILTTDANAANDATLNIAYENGTASGLTEDATSVDTVAGVAQDTATLVGGKIRTALGIAAITDNYTVGGATTDIILTVDAIAADDATLNIAYDNGTAAGLTPNATSVNTTPGVATDDATSVATKVRTEFNIAAITDNYTVSGSGTEVILTTIAKAANDATLNIGYADGTSTGLTPDATSADTVAGVVADTASVVGGKVRTALGIAAITDNYTVSGATTDIILTADALAANDTTLNIAYNNGTSSGLTPDTTSVNTTTGDAQDDQDAIATKIRAALITDAAIGHPTTGKFTITGATDEIILTANVGAANDVTLNVSIDNGTCAGITTAATSADTTAGVLGTGTLTAKIYGLSLTGIEQNETAQMNGKVGIELTLDYSRVFSVETITIGTNLSNVGIVYVGTGILTTGAPAVKWTAMAIGKNESQMAIWTVPTGKTLIITSLYPSTDDTESSSLTIYSRVSGSVFKPENTVSLYTGGEINKLSSPIVLSAGTDIDCRGIVALNTSGMSYLFEGYYK